MSEPLRLEWRSPAELAENPRNWRRHPEAQIAALGDVLGEVGWAGACLYNERTGRLIDGHARKKVAVEQGCEKVPVLVGSWDEAAEAKILATLDPLSAMAEADAAALDALLRDVQTGSQAIGDMLTQLAEGAGIVPPGANAAADDPGPQIDRAKDLQEKWQTATGQLWVIPSLATPGKEHRLLCGDSTKAEDVARVMGGERAAACVTDPPYGVGVDYESFKDTEENVRILIDKVMPTILSYLPAALTPGVPAMWDYPRPAWVGAWVHPAPTSSGTWGFVGCNPILYYGDDPYLAAGRGRRDSSCVMVADRKGEDEHPVSKPLGVWKWLLQRMMPDEGVVVFDPFLGSGTTLVAAEQTGRLCRGIEISAAYIGVCLERLAGMGLKPVQQFTHEKA